MELLELPDELLSKVFRFLPATELAKVGLVCQRLQAIANGSEHLWKWYCRRDFKVTEQQLWNGWSFKKFYTEALYKYRFAFGWWQRDIKYYGGLLIMKLENDAFVAYECLPPLDDFNVQTLVWVGLISVPDGTDYTSSTFHQLRMNRVFAVEPRGSKVAVVCYQQDQNGTATVAHNVQCGNAMLRDGHECNDTCHERDAVVEKTSDGLRFNCPEKQLHNWSNAYFLRLYHGIVPRREDCIDAIIEEFEDEGYELNQKFHSFGNAVCNSKFMPISIQRQLPPAAKIQCVKPGVYSSMYSVHGWELINFRYGDDGKTFEGIKIKGDPNVPAGQFTVRVQLTKPVLLTKDDQLWAIEIEKAIDRARPGWTDALSEDQEQLALRSFRTPMDCHICNEGVEMPKFFRGAAYMCECQVAETGFIDPKIEQGLFYGFDDDTFVILWLEDRSFFHYFRATNMDSL